jgi:hypothetical protein
MIGAEVYRLLVTELERGVPLPHPALRKKNGRPRRVPSQRSTPVQG